MTDARIKIGGDFGDLMDRDGDSHPVSRLFGEQVLRLPHQLEALLKILKGRCEIDQPRGPFRSPANRSKYLEWILLDWVPLFDSIDDGCSLLHVIAEDARLS